MTRSLVLSRERFMDLHHTWAYLRARVGDRPHDEQGASLVEYAFLVALIAMVCIAAVTTLGSNANSTFSFVGSSIKP